MTVKVVGGNGAILAFALLMVFSNTWAGCLDEGADKKSVIESCLAAAEEGDAEAQAVAGLYYMSELGGADKGLAAKWFWAAAERGDANGQYMLDKVCAEAGLDFWLSRCEGRRWNEKAAIQGHAGAQLQLGLNYRYGSRGLEKSPAKAREWIARSATSGSPEAQYIMGRAYRDGREVLQDYKKAVMWLEKAANQRGDVITRVLAQNALGYMYRDGFGVEKSYVLAHMWWNLASSLGNESALKERDAVAKKMSTSQINKAQGLARDWRSTSG